MRCAARHPRPLLRRFERLSWGLLVTAMVKALAERAQRRSRLARVGKCERESSSSFAIWPQPNNRLEETIQPGYYLKQKVYAEDAKAAQRRVELETPSQLKLIYNRPFYERFGNLN